MTRDNISTKPNIIKNIKSILEFYQAIGFESLPINPPESPHTPLWKRDNPPKSPFIKGGLEGDFKGVKEGFKRRGQGGITVTAQDIEKDCINIAISFAKE